MKKILLVPLSLILLLSGSLWSGSQKSHVNAQNAETPQAQNTNTGEISNSDLTENNQISTSIQEVYADVNAEYSWAKDPSFSKNLIQDNTSIVKIKTLCVNDAEFLVGTTDPRGDNRPYTPILVEISETLYGDKLQGKVTLYQSGGKVLIRDAIKHLPPEKSQKMGLNELTAQEQGSMYLHFGNEETDYDLIENHDYVVMVNRSKENLYGIASGGYGVFEAADGKNYKNVITGNPLEF